MARMTAEQREWIADLGPYTLNDRGAIIDVNGAALASMAVGGEDQYEACEWDLAAVAALNEVYAAEEARRRG